MSIPDRPLMPFRPLAWVTINFTKVNYKGRIAKCHLGPNDEWTFTVEYVDDRGEFKSGEFRSDELE